MLQTASCVLVLRWRGGREGGAGVCLGPTQAQAKEMCAESFLISCSQIGPAAQTSLHLGNYDDRQGALASWSYLTRCGDGKRPEMEQRKGLSFLEQHKHKQGEIGAEGSVC